MIKVITNPVLCESIIITKNCFITFSYELSKEEREKEILNSFITSLEWYKQEILNKKYLKIYTNDEYFYNLMTDWFNKWKYNNFDININKPRPNKELLLKINTLLTNINWTVFWKINKQDKNDSKI